MFVRWEVGVGSAAPALCTQFGWISVWLEQVVERRRGVVPRAAQVAPDESAAALEDVARDQHGVDVPRVGLMHDRRDRIDHRVGIRVVAADTTMSACLPGVSEPVRSSSPHTRAPSIVANSSTWRVVSSAAPRCCPLRTLLVRDQAVRGPQEPHLREHVAGHGGYDVDAEAWSEPVSEHPRSRRGAVAHRHLDGGRD